MLLVSLHKDWQFPQEVELDNGEPWDGEAAYTFMYPMSSFPLVLFSKHISNTNTFIYLLNDASFVFID